MKPELYVKIYIKNEKHSFSILESIVRKIAMKGNMDQLFLIESFFSEHLQVICLFLPSLFPMNILT